MSCKKYFVTTSHDMHICCLMFSRLVHHQSNLSLILICPSVLLYHSPKQNPQFTNNLHYWLFSFSFWQLFMAVDFIKFSIQEGQFHGASNKVQRKLVCRAYVFVFVDYELDQYFIFFVWSLNRNFWHHFRYHNILTVYGAMLSVQ